jgi:hypothetical protein
MSQVDVELCRRPVRCAAFSKIYVNCVASFLFPFPFPLHLSPPRPSATPPGQLPLPIIRSSPLSRATPLALPQPGFAIIMQIPRIKVKTYPQAPSRS